VRDETKNEKNEAVKMAVESRFFGSKMKKSRGKEELCSDDGEEGTRVAYKEPTCRRVTG